MLYDTHISSSARPKNVTNAFCAKCQKQTETLGAKTFPLFNGSRALSGSCKDCESHVYKIMGPSQYNEPLKKTIKAAAPRRLAQSPRHPVLQAKSAVYAANLQPRWQYYAAFGAVMAIIATFFAYSIL